MWIKYCGMTRLEDVLYAQELGVDAVGFIFTKSPRQITPQAAAEICNNTKVPKVGVFMDQEVPFVNNTATLCNLDYIQLHGSETPAYCEQIEKPVIKAFRVKDSDTITNSENYKQVFKKLFDAYVPGQAGGTGKLIDKQLLMNLNLDEIILAGGITPDTVLELLSEFTPFGIDTSSGIEDAPGIKNHSKMERLIKTVKEIYNNG